MTSKPQKRRVSGGRVTAKGTHPDGFVPNEVRHTGSKYEAPSPMWVPILAFGLLGLGIVLIIINYVAVFWDTSNALLLLGLGFILGGIMAFTQYR